MPKVTGPARPWSAWVACEPAQRRTTMVGINLWWVENPPYEITAPDALRFSGLRLRSGVPAESLRRVAFENSREEPITSIPMREQLRERFAFVVFTAAQ